MKPIVNTIVIQRPIEEVFDVATCQRRCVTWHTGMVSSQKVTDGPVGVGSEYEQQARFLGFTGSTRTRITRWEPPYHFAAASEGPSSSYSFALDFEAVDGGTQVTCTVINSEPRAVLARFSEPLIHLTLERMNDRDFHTLKELLETESPILAEQVQLA